VSAHICTTYSIEPTPGDCPGCVDIGVIWASGEEPKDRLWCHEHMDGHEGRDIHTECEACELERNEQRTLSEDEIKEKFASGGVCDAHLWEEEEEEDE
jgi:hypothetical protein